MSIDLSPAERRALDYCAPRGVPLSVFLGRVVGHGEAQWLPEDTEAALWWQDQQALRCSGCGQPREEAMGEDGPDYEAVTLRCFACQATAAKQAEISRDAQRDRTLGYGMYIFPAKIEEEPDGNVPVAG